VTRKVRVSKGKTRTVTSTSLLATADGTLTNATNWTNAVSFSPDGKMLAAGTSEGSVLVWTLAGHALAARIPAPQPVTSVAWDGADRVADTGADGTATIWTLPAPVLMTGNKAASVAYSPNGAVIAVGGTNVELWNRTTDTLLATRATPGVNSLSFSPDGKYLAAALGDGTVLVMGAATLAPVGKAFPVTGSGSAESVAFSPVGQVLATGSDDGTLRFFSLADPAHPVLLSKVKDSGPPVYTVAFAPDGATLAAASTDDETRLWNVTNPASPQLDGAPLGGLSSYAIALAFAPNSTLLVVGSADKTVHLWNVTDPAQAVQVGAPLTGPSGYVWGAAISPDSTTLAVGSTDGSVWLWNIVNPSQPTLIATLTGPAGHVYSVAFSPDGTQLAASSYDGTVHLWDTSPTAARATVCADLGQPLTSAEWAAYVPGIPYKAPCS
jgi:WD40 repeat protein